MFRPFASASLLALVSTAALADEDVTHFRVFVGDHAAAEVTAFDLAAPENRWRFATTGQAKLFAVAGGAVVVAVQSDADVVHFLHSGITMDSHGDHSDIKVSAPTAFDTVLTGPRPFHLVDHDGKVVINHDKGGYADVLDGAALAKGQVAPVKFPQGQPHHGFVTPLGNVWLSTVAQPAPADGSPALPRPGVQAFTADGVPAGDLAICTGVHGEAFSGDYLAAGCKEGVLTVKARPDGPDYRMLPYPADLPAGVTTGTLLGSAAMQVFLGNHGPDALVVIDPAEAPAFRRIALPFRRVDFVLDPAQPAQGFVLTEDGSLHRIDLLGARITASARATGAYSMDGHWNDPRPRLAMAGAEVLVTDPAAGLVRRIATADLAEVGTVAVGGTPYNLTVVGGSGLDH